MILKSTGILIFLIILLSCSSSTQLTDIYVDKNFAAEELKKVLVLGIAKEDWKKKVYENEFRSELRKHNIEVLTAWQELPKGEELTKETFEKYFKDQNVDAVLVAIAAGESTEETLYSGGTSHVYMGFYGFYFSTAAVFYSPGYLSEEKIVHMKTNLYETGEGKIIWSAKSQSYEPKNTKEVIQTVSRDVVDELYLAGFVK
ncbi:MAG: hypothetical protein KJN64_05635 [Ignavibacteria bacterium]|nr:hypothetical protein [Ignavibacteria bacterium]MBT8382058.1 hypothetical protein [Ignavibacteria bacterium]MBT8392473.1 hypothetical protein [Ignavibacteria bacterium]NNJ52055.1 hypothetical protein [Ignavibacteriaceae bacterium]NNL19896.1 hypothetical protein [Ignavibacteriaceae bacterium]